MRRRLAAALAIALALPPSALARDLDWCAPVVVRPDQSYRNGESPSTGQIPTACFPAWPDVTTASYADLVYLIGDNFGTETPAAGVHGWQVAQAQYPITCWGYRMGTHPNKDMSWSSLGLFIDRLNTMRPPGMAALKTVLAQRSELVSTRDMVRSGFDASWLVTTTTPWPFPTWATDGGSTWSDGVGWYNGSSPTACGSDSSRECLKRLINQAAGQDAASGTAWEGKVYYVDASSGYTVFWPKAVVAKVSDSGYRAWKVTEMAAARTATGATHVELSQKLWMRAQYLAPDSGCALPDGTRYGNTWISGPCATDLAAYRADGNKSEFSGQPTGETYEQYVFGLGDLADELVTAGVPFTWLASRTQFGAHDGGGTYTPSDFLGTERRILCEAVDNPWDCCTGLDTGSCGDLNDDPASVANESEEIRRIALEKADVVLLDAQSSNPAVIAETETLAAKIRLGSGSPEVIVVRSSNCPQGDGFPFAMPWK